MGYWGTGLYSNDCTCDVRDTYLGYLNKGVPNEEAYKKTVNALSEYMGTEEEPLVWYALADTQWKHGRLEPFVKSKAQEWLDKEGGVSLWEKNPDNANKWKRVLEELTAQLSTTQGLEKNMLDMFVVQFNPGYVGDVFAYRFHSKAAKENGYLGKYILMHKIGEKPGVFWGKQMIPLMIVYDMIFDKIPNEIDISKFRLLPFSVAETYMPTGRNINFPTLQFQATFALHRKNHSPKKHIQFVGNFDIPRQIENYPEKHCRDYAWDRLEETLIWFHNQWKDYSYQLFSEESVVSKKPNE